MANKLQRPGPARAASTVERHRAPLDRWVNVGLALVRSDVTRLYDRPYPILLREQGAIDAWARALGNTGLWPYWQDAGTLCWEIRQEVLRQVECMSGSPTVFGRLSAEERQRLAFVVSMNLKYHLSQGAVIEATGALETLLTNSDVDLSLPMSMVRPSTCALAQLPRAV